MPQHRTPSTTKARRRPRPSSLLVGLLAAAMVFALASPASAEKKDTSSDTSSSDTSTAVDLGGAMSLLEVAEAIGATDLWAEGITGDGVDVALIDTGVAPVPALAGDGVVLGPDLSFEGGFGEVAGLDTYGHGTHMAGLITASQPGVDPTVAKPGDTFGVAPDSRLLSVKVGDSNGAVDVSQVIAAVEWVVANRNAGDLDIRVLSLSYNTTSELGYIDDPLARALENAWDAGIVVVVSAGNDGRGTRELANPANDPHVIAVSPAQQKNNGKWKIPSWATRGDGDRNPDVVAPGQSIASLRAPGSTVDVANPSGRIAGAAQLFKGSGTSQAAAVVAGAAALLIDADPTLTPDEVKAKLTATAIKVHNQESFQGHGLIDVAAAADHTPTKVTQDHQPSTGLGSLEAARGDAHVTINGQTLQGETTFTGSSWTGSSWTGSSWTGSSWTGSSWTGSSWTGSSWTGSSWTGSSWTGSSWTGSSWTGSSWTGSSWTGSSWTGSSWTGSSWR